MGRSVQLAQCRDATRCEKRHAMVRCSFVISHVGQLLEELQQPFLRHAPGLPERSMPAELRGQMDKDVMLVDVKASIFRDAAKRA